MMQKTFQANRLKKQVGVSILIWDKVDFKPKQLRRDKNGHYILINRKIRREDIDRDVSKKPSH